MTHLVFQVKILYEGGIFIDNGIFNIRTCNQTSGGISLLQAWFNLKLSNT